MAVIENEGKTVKVEDGDKIITACNQLGVPFGCKGGACGVCEIEIEEGAENLSYITEEEEMMGVKPPFRLACMCKILKGTVKIKF